MKELSNKTKEYLKNVEDHVNEQFKDAECVTTDQIRNAVYKELGLSKEEGNTLIKLCKKIFPDNDELIKGRCKCCKHFEYDVVAMVDGIPLIVGHEMCNKWGNGCKTREDGYCFLFEPIEN